MSLAHHRVLPPAVCIPPRDLLLHTHFDVEAFAPEKRMLAWRERVGHVVDVLPTPTRADAARTRPMVAGIDRFQGDDLVFTEVRSDALDMERSLARISVDRVREFAFHIFLEGGVDALTAYGKTMGSSPAGPSVLALDLNQPFRMHRRASHGLTLFLPVEAVEVVFSDPGVLHGRMLSPTKSLTRLIVNHAAALSQHIRGIDRGSANAAMRATADMLLAAFGKQLRLRGNGHGIEAAEAGVVASNAAISAQVRRYISANLHLSELTPEHVQQVFRLPRPTLYRLFQHEGGIGAYIRQMRLRQAAELLIRNPAAAVIDIAFELGFNSASDFTRAFRRAYETTPREYRLKAHVVAK